MSLNVVLRPEAANDLLSAREWYELQRPGLGDEFANSADELLSRITTWPESHAVVFQGVRLARMRRFPYVAYYRILAESIELIAVLHGSRSPRIWRERTQ